MRMNPQTCREFKCKWENAENGQERQLL
uniref:Uncharacterized protein n=1 Tax=Musa acuminata subsp. malaccensis TaxID=214687 RepID=A0A804KZF0_MUSAM